MLRKGAVIFFKNEILRVFNLALWLAKTVFFIFFISLQFDSGPTSLEDPVWTPDPSLHCMAHPAVVRIERLVERL